MRTILTILVMILSFSPTKSYADDVDIIYRIGEATKKAGVAVDYRVSGWNQYLDLNIGSMLPGDARTVASAACQLARNKGLKRPWTVRVFLVVGDRPAATCVAE